MRLKCDVEVSRIGRIFAVTSFNILRTEIFPYGDFLRTDFYVRGFLRTGISTYGDLRREDFSVRGFLRTQILVSRGLLVSKD